MTIQQCKYVLEILKMGSFNEAAKTLYVAQSSLSASVKSLESELNIKIFERSNNGVRLTSDGAEFVRYASQIIEQNDLILAKYKSNQRCKKLYIATQHYDFVADIFGKMLNLVTDDYIKKLQNNMQEKEAIYIKYLGNIDGKATQRVVEATNQLRKKKQLSINYKNATFKKNVRQMIYEIVTWLMDKIGLLDKYKFPKSAYVERGDIPYSVKNKWIKNIKSKK